MATRASERASRNGLRWTETVRSVGRAAVDLQMVVREGEDPSGYRNGHQPLRWSGRDGASDTSTTSRAAVGCAFR